MELVNSRKLKDSEFCSVCDKERKHLIVTYQGINDNNESYTLEMKRCKSCGQEQSLI